MIVVKVVLCFLAAASALNTSCDTSCRDLFSLEFDAARLACNSTLAVCSCKLQVLDLTSCVAADSQGTTFVLTVSDPSNTSSNKYTAACKATIQRQGPCQMDGIKDKGFQITSTEALFAGLGVGFELLSGYQIVSDQLFIKNTSLKCLVLGQQSMYCLFQLACLLSCCH